MAIESAKYYRIKGSSLLSLLIAAGVSGGGVTALFASDDLANAKSIQHRKRVTATLSAASVKLLFAIVDADLCPAVDAQFDLPPGTCTADKLAARVVGNIDVTPSEPDDKGAFGEYDIGAQLSMPGLVAVSLP